MSDVIPKRIITLQEQSTPVNGDVMLLDNPSGGTKQISIANLQDSTLDNIENKTFSFDNGDATIVTEINNINDRIDSMDISGGLFASGSLITVSNLTDFQNYLLSLDAGTVMGCITATTDIDDGGNVTVLYSGENMIVASINSGNISGILASSNDYRRVVGVSYNNSVWNYGYIGVMQGTGSNSEIFNDTNNISSGAYAHAEGYMTRANLNYAHAEGYATIAGLNSHAEGDTTIAANGSHAEGDGTSAIGVVSHTEGIGTTAPITSIGSHAEGYNTEASGVYSHSENFYTRSSGEASHSEGSNTIASGKHQHVQGRYNIEDNNSVYSHIVGNGTSENARSNAHTLDWSGNAWFAGDITDGLGNVLSNKIDASDVDTSVPKANELYDHYNKCKQITALPTEAYSYNFTVASSITKGATMPSYSKGVFVTTGVDGIILATHHNGSIYCAYRNGSTWGDIYDISVKNIGTTVRSSGAATVANNTTVTTHTISLTAGTWLITGYIQWGSGFSQNYNHTISCNNKNHTVRNIGTNGGGSSNTMIVTLTSSVNATQSVWQDSGSSKSLGGTSELMAVRIK